MKRSWIKRGNSQLKRSWLKRGNTKPLKQTPIRKKSKSIETKIQDAIWAICKTIIRRRHGNTCYTCFATGLVGKNWHTGHMWAKASLGAWLKYDLRILRPQCYNCNMNLGGMGAAFYRRMLAEYGKEYMDNLNKERQVTVNALDHYRKILPLYQQLLINDPYVPIHP